MKTFKIQGLLVDFCTWRENEVLHGDWECLWFLRHWVHKPEIVVSKMVNSSFRLLDSSCHGTVSIYLCNLQANFRRTLSHRYCLYLFQFFSTHNGTFDLQHATYRYQIAIESDRLYFSIFSVKSQVCLFSAFWRVFSLISIFTVKSKVYLLQNFDEFFH